MAAGAGGARSGGREVGEELAEVGFVGADGVRGIAGAGEIFEIEDDVPFQFRRGQTIGIQILFERFERALADRGRGALSCRGAGVGGRPRRAGAAGRR